MTPISIAALTLDDLVWDISTPGADLNLEPIDPK